MAFLRFKSLMFVMDRITERNDGLLTIYNKDEIVFEGYGTITQLRSIVGQKCFLLEVVTNE